MSELHDRVLKADEELRALLLEFIELDPRVQLETLRRWKLERSSAEEFDLTWAAFIRGEPVNLTTDLLMRGIARESTRAGLRGAQSRLRAFQVILDHLRRKEAEAEKAKRVADKSAGRDAESLAKGL